MSANTEILCSRCGTPFASEGGQLGVTCLVCGQLRPDLDLTLDDDDEIPSPASTTPTSPLMGSPSPIVSSTLSAPPAMPMLSGSPSASTGGAFRIDHAYMSLASAEDARISPYNDTTYSARISCVILIAVPVAAAMAGGLAMLAEAPDFSQGTWCAVAIVAILHAVLALMSAGFVTFVLYAAGLRQKLFLRIIFLMIAAAVTYVALNRIPRRIQCTESLPTFNTTGLTTSVGL